jgi:hypothetical protein
MSQGKTTGELVTGIIGTVDIGSIIANVISLSLDMSQSQTLLTQLEQYLYNSSPSLQSDIVATAQLSPEAIVSRAKDRWKSHVVYLADEARAASGLSATGSKMASSIKGLATKVYSALNEVDTYDDVLYGIPEAVTRFKAKEYYNKLLAPNRPSDALMMIMAKEGTIPYQDVVTKYQEEEGLSSNYAYWVASIRAQQIGKPDLQTYWTMVKKGLILESEWYLLAQRGYGYSKTDAMALYKQFSRKPSEADLMIMAKSGLGSYGDCLTTYQENGLNPDYAGKLVTVRAQQIGKPDLHTYWNMVRKGLILENEWYLLAQKGHGYTKEDADALYKEFYYTLSPMELFRISDLMPTSATWIDKKLSALGLSDEDKTLIASLISARTTKDEVTATWNIIADNYAWGLQTTDDLTKFLTDNHVPDIQAKAKLIIADLLRAKVVMKLNRDSEIYLYRKDVQNENQLLTALESLNISFDVANAITRNEAAKKGIDWEIPP